MPITNWTRVPTPKQIQAMALTRDEAKRKITNVGWTLLEHILLVMTVDRDAAVVGHWAGEVAKLLDDCCRYGTNLKKTKDLDATAITGFVMADYNARPALLLRDVRKHQTAEATPIRRDIDAAVPMLHGTIQKLVTFALSNIVSGTTRSDVLNLIP